MASLHALHADIRRSVFFSYLEKLLVVVIAIAAFLLLARLGDAKKNHDEARKYHLNQQTLRDLAERAKRMAGPPPDRDVAILLDGVAASFTDKQAEEARDRFTTPAEFAATVERLVDVQIWRSDADVVARIKDDDKSTLANTEAKTRALIAASHALIDAAVLTLPVEKDIGFNRIYDDEDSLHVMYEILWYASLIVGVIAASYLLLIIFAAMPFTSLSGHWTKRVSELLDKIGPGVARAGGLMAAAPLAAAIVIGGGVAGGAANATVAGGASRPIVHEHAPVTFEGPTIEGATNHYDFSVHLQEQRPTLKCVYHGISKEDLDQSLFGVSNTIARRSIESQAMIDRLDRSVQEFMDTDEGAAILAREAWESGTRSETMIDGVSRTVGGLEDKTSKMKRAQENDEKVDNDLLAQAAYADNRGFLRRAFGFTQFWVGPAVIDVMKARLGIKALDEKTNEGKYIKALGVMNGKKAMNFLEFDRAVVKYARGKSDVIAENRRALLRLCALPRE